MIDRIKPVNLSNITHENKNLNNKQKHRKHSDMNNEFSSMVEIEINKIKGREYDGSNQYKEI